MKKIDFSKSKFRGIEVCLSAMSLYWGVLLALPADTFSTSAAYATMCEIAPELFWGVLMITVGMVHLLAMIKNHKCIRKLGLLLAAGQWYFIASMLFLGNYFSTGWGAYFIVACLATWLYVKVGGQYE